MNRLETERMRLQAELDALRTQRQRNVMGQFATPGQLALEMLESAHDLTCERTDGLRFMDPAFGTGSFYSALLRVYRRESIAAAYGYEIDPHYGVPSSRLWEPSGLRLELSDFTGCRPDSNGRERVDLLVCNPPYVRHHHIERSMKLRLGREAAEQLGIRVSGLAGLYVFFMLLSHKWLRPDSLSIWLIPSEFMDVNYGSALKEYLLNYVDLIRIHRFDPSEAQFEDALVSSAVVWFRNRRPVPGSTPEFTLGGSLAQPRLRRRLPRDELRRESKWTRFPEAGTASEVNGVTLRDFFTNQARDSHRSQPVLHHGRTSGPRVLDPATFSPTCTAEPPVRRGRRCRHRSETVCRSSNGPCLSWTAVCRLKSSSGREPETADYVKRGESEGVNEGYLASRRDPWYSL